MLTRLWLRAAILTWALWWAYAALALPMFRASADSTVSKLIATRTIAADPATSLPATAFYSIGVPLKDADVPSILTADLGGTSVPFGCVARVTDAADGSLAWADCDVDMSGVAISAGTTKDLHIKASPGTWPSTNHRSNNDFLTLGDTVELTNLVTSGTQAQLTAVNTASNYLQFAHSQTQWTVTIAGSATNGDVLTVTVTNISGSPQTGTYTVATGNSTTVMATQLTASLNASTLPASGFVISSSSNVITLVLPTVTQASWTVAFNATGSATETATLAAQNAWTRGGGDWYATGDAAQFLSAGALPAPLAAATTYGLCQIVATPTRYVVYDSTAHAAAGGASCNNATGLITLTTAGNCSLTASPCNMVTTPEVDMQAAGTWICPFDGTATVTAYGNDQVAKRAVVKAICSLSGNTHRHLVARMEYDDYETQALGQGPIASRGPFIENLFAFKRNPSEFDYDIAWKRGGVVKRSQVGVQQAVFSSAPLTRADGLRDWTANDPKVTILADYNQTRATKKIQPFKAGIVSTFAMSWAVSAANNTTGAITATGYGFLGDSGSQTQVAVDFTSGSLPGNITAGQPYWTCRIDGSTFKIYDTMPHATASQFGTTGCTGATGLIVPSATFTGTVQNSIAPISTGQMNKSVNDTGNTEGLGLNPEWAVQYHVANTTAAQRQARVMAYSMGNPTYAVINDATGRMPCLLPAIQCPTGPDMGAHKETTIWSSCSFTNAIATFASNDIGGGGCWTGSNGPFGTWDSSHWTSPVYGVWLMEGGAYLRDLLYQNANRPIAYQGFLPNRNFQVGGAGTVYYGLVLYSTDPTQVRFSAWAFRDILYARMAAEDGSAEQQYLDNVIDNNLSAYLAQTAVLDPNLQAFGWYSGGGNSALITAHNFMQHYVGTVVSMGALLFGDHPTYGTKIQAFNNNYMGTFYATNFVNNFCSYYLDQYIWGPNTEAGVFMTTIDNLGFGNGSDLHFGYNSATNLVTITAGGNPFTSLAAGDKFRPDGFFSLLGPAGNPATAPPSPLVKGTWYFIKTVTNGATPTFQLENSPGSGTIAFGSTVANGGGMMHSEQACPGSGSASASTANAVGDYAIAVEALGICAVSGNANCATAFATANARVTFNYNAQAKFSVQGTP